VSRSFRDEERLCREFAERLQRIVLGASRPEPVPKSEEVFLVDCFENRRDRPLDEFCFPCTECSAARFEPSAFLNVSSSGRTRSVTAVHSGAGQLARSPPLPAFLAHSTWGSSIVLTRSCMPPARRPRGRAGRSWRNGLATAHQRIILFHRLRVAHHFNAGEQFDIA
jgi:hypothetical protein